jgi:hypothetical protein
LLWIGASPVSEAREEPVTLVVLLNPVEPNRFVFETPRANEFEGFVQQRIDSPQIVQQRIDSPQKQSAVVGREVRNGERGEGFEI